MPEFETLDKSIIDKYLDGQQTRISNLLTFANYDWEIGVIKGWDILDLGCGSAESSKMDGFDKGEFEAWFPRFCHDSGAKSVTGVDIFAQDPKDVGIYTHIRANLIRLLFDDNLVKLFGEKKFDLINMFGVVMSSGAGKAFEATSFNVQAENLIENLKSQSIKLLKPAGLLACETSFYRFDDKNNCLIDLFHAKSH